MDYILVEWATHRTVDGWVAVFQEDPCPGLDGAWRAAYMVQRSQVRGIHALRSVTLIKNGEIVTANDNEMSQEDIQKYSAIVKSTLNQWDRSREEADNYNRRHPWKCHRCGKWFPRGSYHAENGKRYCLDCYDIMRGKV